MFTWNFDERPTIYNVMADAWFVPQLQYRPHLQPPVATVSSVIEVVEPKSVPRHPVTVNNAAQVSLLEFDVSAAAARLSPARQSPGSPGHCSLGQYHRKPHGLSCGSGSGRHQHQHQQQRLHQGGDHSRSSSTSPLLPCCVIPVNDIAPNIVASGVGNAGHQQHQQQQQHQKLQQQRLPHPNTVAVLPATF